MYNLAPFILIAVVGGMIALVIMEVNKEDKIKKNIKRKDKFLNETYQTTNSSNEVKKTSSLFKGNFFKYTAIFFVIVFIFWVLSNIPKLWWIVFSAVLTALVAYEYLRRR